MPYSWSRRARSAGFPLTWTVPAVGLVRSPMIRSSVDLPQPDGPDQRDELARLDVEVDPVQRGRRRRLNCFETPLSETALTRRAPVRA